MARHCTGITLCNSLHLRPGSQLTTGTLLAKWTTGAESALTYLHTDHLGTPVRGTHALGRQLNPDGLPTTFVGAEIFSDFSSPYGLNPLPLWHGHGGSGFDPATGQGSNCGVTGFTTHVRDCDTGLQYMQARYYDAGLARFLSIDPVTFLKTGNPSFFNRYSYAFNDPVNLIDPDGRSPLRDMYHARGDGRLPENLRQPVDTGPAGVALAVVALPAAGVVILATPGPEELVVAGALATTARTAVTAKKTYQTYTKTNKKTGEVYSGRTSGTGSPAENVANRDKNHHMDGDDWGEAVLDKSSSNPDAIRGREQQLIDAHGGAKSQGGTSGNAINGIADTNPKRDQYLDAANKEF